MSGPRVAATPAGYRGAAENKAKPRSLQPDSSTIIELIVRRGGRVLCLMHVQPEPVPGGWQFEGLIPWAVL